MDWGAIGNLSAVAIMGVIFWHVITKGIPSIIERFTAENKEAREAYVAENKAARAEFKDSLKEVVDHCREENRFMSDQLLKARSINSDGKS